MAYIKWKSVEENILRKHWNVGSGKLISQLLPLKTWSSIQHKAHRLNLKRDQSNTNFCKFSSFSNGISMVDNLLKDSPDAFYWIGYIFADGSIYKRKDGQFCFSLGCSIKDIKHINKFCKFINKNKVIIKKRSTNGFVGTDMAVVEFKDKHMLPKLIKKFHFNLNKTYNPPVGLSIKDDDLFTAFLIGYIDGDGCVSKVGEIVINCHYSWKNQLNTWFLRIWNLSKCKLGQRNIKIPKARIIKTPYSDQAAIRTMNNNFIHFLKNKAISLDLPIIYRKWDRIK